MWDSIVIGAGQAGLSTSFHLHRLGVRHLVLDANTRPGGAWQHRWDALTMSDVHGVADLPDAPLPATHGPEAANTFVPDYFTDYETRHDLPVVRPVVVRAVHDEGEALRIEAEDGRTWHARTLVNATGTWRRPFVPYYAGREVFAGEQLHTVDFGDVERFRGRRVLVVGGGASAVQFLGMLRPLTDTLWVTRREPVWRTDEFDQDAGREAVALVEERVRQGLPPRSVVSVTGLMLRPQEQEAARLGAYERRPMFSRIERDGVRWADGTFERVDVILWATGFRPDVEHLAPLGLRSPLGGIRLGDTTSTSTTAVADPRVQLVGYGPSASTIGANRAGRVAARAVARRLEQAGAQAS
ncbi:NAD(P)-binding domain-containing protein [Aeromicrobium choanae]|uniref:Predicted flavoprotein CzcO associated with the cation diffusion facilitator CzcD n=1 Tax=Aeromicrobium choanae TaxID=1736691 RepID=A0A1T4YR33_9ACTN|nr:NAD(P)-binding domain-containing protein [Aeromicrobium choanae]SKB03711.1 Predicted flavoprotein CzcO associated with the cation diffusion facilitator CzcD [Aeromicrobium choanae]